MKVSSDIAETVWIHIENSLKKTIYLFLVSGFEARPLRGKVLILINCFGTNIFEREIRAGLIAIGLLQKISDVIWFSLVFSS